MDFGRNGDFNNWPTLLPWEFEDYLECMAEMAMEDEGYDFGAINEQVMWVGDQCPFSEDEVVQK